MADFIEAVIVPTVFLIGGVSFAVAGPAGLGIFLGVLGLIGVISLALSRMADQNTSLSTTPTDQRSATSLSAGQKPPVAEPKAAAGDRPSEPKAGKTQGSSPNDWY